MATTTPEAPRISRRRFIEGVAVAVGTAVVGGGAVALLLNRDSGAPSGILSEPGSPTDLAHTVAEVTNAVQKNFTEWAKTTVLYDTTATHRENWPAPSWSEQITEGALGITHSYSMEEEPGIVYYSRQGAGSNAGRPERRIERKPTIGLLSITEGNWHILHSFGFLGGYKWVQYGGGQQALVALYTTVAHPDLSTPDTQIVTYPVAVAFADTKGNLLPQYPKTAHFSKDPSPAVGKASFNTDNHPGFWAEKDIPLETLEEILQNNVGHLISVSSLSRGKEDMSPIAFGVRAEIEKAGMFGDFDRRRALLDEAVRQGQAIVGSRLPDWLKKGVVANKDELLSKTHFGVIHPMDAPPIK